MWVKFLISYVIFPSRSYLGSVRFVHIILQVAIFIFWSFLVFQIDEHVQREIMNHRSLKHPNIIRFKEVIF